MAEQRGGISVVTILGTTRPGHYTGKALALVNDELRKRRVRLTTLDPAGRTLPFPGQPETEDARTLRVAVKRATGIVLATPEYHGCFSSMMKLIIENLGFPSVLSGKPVALLGVAAGRIGAIKSLEQLRGVCSHVGAIVLPAPVSVAQVRDVFDESGQCRDEETEKLIRGVAKNLLTYIERHICPRLTLEAMVRGEAA